MIDPDDLIIWTVRLGLVALALALLIGWTVFTIAMRAPCAHCP